jgi:flagellar hook protein FlgE
MLRSMYSGVSGLKAHQTKMDVIGNNIANVNTYGFKSSRTTFSEVYYQTVRSASGATVNQGGMNANQIGYGVNVATIDVQHTRSGFQMTDNGMDIAIAGEGFFQVQDGDGNVFYTRAGMIRIDASGNLVDQNGNFVLGVSGNPLGKDPSSNKIQIQVPSTEPVQSIITEIINGLSFSLKAVNPTKNGNISFNFTSTDDMPLGQKVSASITSNGINISLNDNETFSDLAELNNSINIAIQEANGGKEHPAGNFNFELNTGTVSWPLSGKNITSSDFNPVLGSITLPTEMTNMGFKLSSVSSKFSGAGDLEMNIKHNLSPNSYTLSIEIDGKTYSGNIPESATTSGKIRLGTDEDAIILEHPGFNALNTKKTELAVADDAQFFATDLLVTNGAVASTASKSLGFGSKTFTLNGGTAGGAQSVSDLSNVGIGADGVISAIHSQLGLISIGRIDIATFENPQGLIQEGNTYFSVSANSGNAKVTNAGLNGAGGLQAGALEMSNVDLSKEFADMITTQRGFQASSRLITVSDEILNELVNLKR